MSECSEDDELNDIINQCSSTECPMEVVQVENVSSEKRKHSDSSTENSTDGFITVSKRKNKSRKKETVDKNNMETTLTIPTIPSSIPAEEFYEVCITSLQPLPKQIAMAKLLKANNIQNILQIRYKSPYKVLIKFTNKNDANSLFTCKQISDLGGCCRLTNECNVCYGIIKGIDLGIEEKEILENITSSCEITFMKRLKRLDTDGKWIDSETFKVIFKSDKLPQYVYGYGCRFKVDTFRFPVTQCSGCWKFGHQIKFCPNKNILCPKCGDKHDNCATVEYKCINCKGDHMALDKSCPIFLKEKKIRDIMSCQNVMYREALNIYLKNKNICYTEENTPTDNLHKRSISNIKSYRDALLPDSSEEIDTTDETEDQQNNNRQSKAEKKNKNNKQKRGKRDDHNEVNFENVPTTSGLTKNKNISRTETERNVEKDRDNENVSKVGKILNKVKNIILSTENREDIILEILKVIYQELKNIFISFITEEGMINKLLKINNG